MNTRQKRLATLEAVTQAAQHATLQALLADYDKQPESGRFRWIESRTDAELQLILSGTLDQDGLRVELFTEAEFRFVAECESDAELDAWIEHLRTTKPHYFTKGKQ